ncbi:hypothetical protein [Aneurinibacillus thermoaerophilus]|uniref:hypothetical protein n=1 Tax=Aneurinibacillus thermoaerophilus TaxID=143495 RepID=UPI002E203E03|nr:hypothetical protein [Aneurinibacillus thermoaerophilus]MED0735943.1 hypothetical protein [Aneurinibacillus thermoaerophilus]
MDEVKETREETREEETRDTSALWLGWIGIVAGIVAFFYAPLLFGGAAVILGLITVFSKANTLGWWAIGLGVVGIIVQWFYRGSLFY